MKSLVSNLFLLVVVCSCTPALYMPNTQNVPLLSEKGQTNITAAFNGELVDVQAAYAVQNNFGLMLNGTLVPKETNVNGNGGKGSFVELGGGYFKPLSEKLLFEIYGLAGLGKMSNSRGEIRNEPLEGGNIESNFSRLGIQPAIGFKSKYFSAAFSSRIASLNYMNPNGELYYAGENITQKIRDKSNYFLVEPALTLRGGIEKVKLQVQFHKSFNLTDKNFPMENDLRATIGLNLQF